MNPEDGSHFSTPLRVNSRPGSVIATGTIRGAHLAVGKNGRAHVAWMGSRKAAPEGQPTPPVSEPVWITDPPPTAPPPADGTFVAANAWFPHATTATGASTPAYQPLVDLVSDKLPALEPR